jgi:hypothetical protein
VNALAAWLAARTKDDGRPLNTPKAQHHYHVLLYLALHPEHTIDRKRIGVITSLQSDQPRGEIGANLSREFVITFEGFESKCSLVRINDQDRRYTYQLNQDLLK